MSKVLIFDTTLRDGEQAPGMTMVPAQKLQMARKLVELRVDIIEAGFPASSESDAEAVRKISTEFGNDVTVAALCRAACADVDKAALALKSARRHRLHVFIPCSDLHISAKLESTREEVRDTAIMAIEHARQSTTDVQFGLEDASRADRTYLCSLVAAGIEAGATTINIADTVGYLTPEETKELIAELYAAVPSLADVTLSVHCHDDLGMGVANSLAGLQAGARQAECTVNGIGERAGNASLEEIVMALATRQAYYGLTTDIDTTKLVPASRLLSEIVGARVAPNKAIVGENAFSHEAGIHQHGMLVNPLTYEIMTPQSVGANASRLVFGRHSGRHALTAVLEQNGVLLNSGQVTRLMVVVKSQVTAQNPIPVAELVATALELARSDGVPFYAGQDNKTVAV